MRRRESAPTSTRRSPGRPRSTATTPTPATGGYFLTADDAEGLVVRPGATTTTRRRTRRCGGAKPRAARGARRQRSLPRPGGSPVRGRARRERRQSRRPRVAAQRAGSQAAGIEIVVTGTGPVAYMLAAAALTLPVSRPQSSCARRPPMPCRPQHPAREKFASAPDGAAFVCIGERCSLPVTKTDDLVRLVQDIRA